MKLRERLKRGLDRPGAIWWAVGIGVLLTLPALATGWLMDDHAIRAILSGDGPEFIERAPWELYRFFLDDQEWRRAAIDAGFLPWYVDSEFHVELMRPLSSLSLALDYTLWPDSAFLAHAHSLLWYGALLLVVGLLYRRLMPLHWLAALAAILYAVDEAHGFPVAWYCNRHALISMVFATLALYAHVIWRREGTGGAAIAAPLLLGIGLLASETAISITAYLFAYALFLDQGSWSRRMVTLVPCAATAVVWRTCYNLLGYGTGGSALMLDPAREPLHFLVALGERLPLLIQGQLTPILPDLAALFTGTSAIILLLVTLALLALITAVLWRLIRRDRLVAFWVTGMIVSAIPACATFVSDRMLFAAGIGGMGLIAHVIGRFSEQSLDDYWTRRSVRVLAVLFIVFHLVLAPLMLPLRAYQPQTMAQSTDDAIRSQDRVGELAGKTLIIVNTPQFNYATYTFYTRRELGLSVPESFLALVYGMHAITVTRVDERSLRLSSTEGFVTSFLDRVFLPPGDRFEPGRVENVSDLTIEVTQVTAEGHPSELMCTFTNGMDDPSLLFTSWSAEGYVPFELPAIGESLEIAAIRPADLMSFSYDGP